MIMSILIKNANIIGAADNYTGDIFIQGESIAAIGKNLDVKADKIIDATGLLAFPGFIDPHVHLEMPFMGTFSSVDHQIAANLPQSARRSQWNGNGIPQVRIDYRFLSMR